VNLRVPHHEPNHGRGKERRSDPHRHLPADPVGRGRKRGLD
jgi:hypothetical protein